MHYNWWRVLEYAVGVPAVVIAVYMLIVRAYLQKKARWYKWWIASILTGAVFIIAIVAVVTFALILYMPLRLQTGHMPSDAEVYATTTKFLMDLYADVVVFALYALPATIVSDIVIIAAAIRRYIHTNA